MNKIWAIGDIHGCYRELMALYKKLLKAGLKPEKDIVVFMGDYMDRGPDSKKVIEQLIKWHKLYSHWIFLFGNHEDIFLNWYYGKQNYQEDYRWSCFLYNGGVETLKSYGLSEPVKKFPKKHIEFMENNMRLFYETDNYIFVHGGLIPNTTIDEMNRTARESSENAETIIKAIIWARDEFIDSKYDWGKKVIFGHSAAFNKRWGVIGQPIIMDNKIGIDGAVCPGANKNLIAIELPEEKFYFQESFAFYDALRNI